MKDDWISVSRNFAGASGLNSLWPAEQLVAIHAAQDRGWPVHFDLLDEFRCVACEKPLIEGERASRGAYFTRLKHVVLTLLCARCAGCAAKSAEWQTTVIEKIELRFAPDGGRTLQPREGQL